MAKKKKNAKKKIGNRPVTFRLARISDEVKAAAIVGHVLVHFGAGYGAQRQTETPGGATANALIFKNPSDLATFHYALLESTIRNLGTKINWDGNPAQRDQITKAAFFHGTLARQKVVTDGTGTLAIDQIISTLRQAQAAMCGSPGAGGGPVCEF